MRSSRFSRRRNLFIEEPGACYFPDSMENAVWPSNFIAGELNSFSSSRLQNSTSILFLISRNTESHRIFYIDVRQYIQRGTKEKLEKIFTILNFQLCKRIIYNSLLD